jgi:hypothetical protein
MLEDGGYGLGTIVRGAKALHGVSVGGTEAALVVLERICRIKNF